MSREIQLQDSLRDLSEFTQNNCQFCGLFKSREQLIWATKMPISDFLGPIREMINREIWVAICADCTKLAMETFKLRQGGVNFQTQFGSVDREDRKDNSGI